MSDQHGERPGDREERAHHESARPDLPQADGGLQPGPGNTFGDEPTGGNAAVDRASGGGVEGSGGVDLHGSDEGLRQAPAGADPVEEASRDFMDLNRSRHA